MAQTSFRHWNPDDLHAATIALLEMANGFVSEDEEPIMGALAQTGLAELEVRLREVLRETPPDKESVTKMLYEAFVAGWACRGAAEAILHDEVPTPGFGGRR